VVQFVGTEIKAGEKVPPERLVTVKLGGGVRNFRRLRNGDRVVKGQLLVQLDDRPARSEVAIKEANVFASKADAEGAKSIANEAEEKLKTAEDLYKKRAIALEEYRAANVTRDKMHYDTIAKLEAWKLAQIELNVAIINLEQYEIRAPASGTIAAIRKRPGEAVRELETVIEIDVPETE
jgi:multidrug resistance efflux pump